MAVVFVTRMEGDKPINEGLCIKCAKEMNIKPVTDLLDKMGIPYDPEAKFKNIRGEDIGTPKCPTYLRVSKL